MLSVRNAQCKRYDKTWFVNCCHTFCSNNFVCSFIVTWRLLTRLLIRFLRKLVARYMKHKECIWDWLLLILQDAKDKKYSFFAQFYCKSKKEKWFLICSWLTLRYFEPYFKCSAIFPHLHLPKSKVVDFIWNAWEFE